MLEEGVRLLELAQKAASLYEKQEMKETKIAAAKQIVVRNRLDMSPPSNG